jgi:2-methylcitrate dehydratase PrpD
VFGTFATAAVTARLLGLDVAATTDAFGNAYARAAGTTLGYQEGAVGQRVMQGLAASAGVFAAQLAAAGIGGMRDCLEGDSGYYAVHEGGRYDRVVLTDDLGVRLHGRDTALKPYPVHRGAVIDIEAALAVARNHRYDPAAITAVRVRYPSRFAEGIARIHAFAPDRADPVGPVAPHFSSSWAVAVGLVRGRAGIDDFTEAGVARLRDAVVPVARRVTGIPDPALDDPRPGLGARVVEVELADGRVLTERVDHAPGGPERPWAWVEVVAKLEDCATRSALPPEVVTGIVELVASLPDLDDAAAIPRLLVARA